MFQREIDPHKYACIYYIIQAACDIKDAKTFGKWFEKNR